MKVQPDDPQRDEVDTHPLDEPLTDAELTDLALAADPDTGVAADAVPIDDFLAPAGTGGAYDRLPSWYLPPVARTSLQGWRRQVVLVLVISFVATAAYGICSVYGFFGL